MGKVGKKERKSRLNRDCEKHEKEQARSGKDREEGKWEKGEGWRRKERKEKDGEGKERERSRLEKGIGRRKRLGKRKGGGRKRNETQRVRQRKRMIGTHLMRELSGTFSNEEKKYETGTMN